MATRKLPVASQITDSEIFICMYNSYFIHHLVASQPYPKDLIYILIVVYTRRRYLLRLRQGRIYEFL
jgi:hypothetical protein